MGTRENLGLMFFSVLLKVLMQGFLNFLQEKTSVLRVAAARVEAATGGAATVAEAI
jgi:hypothetical protein